MTHKIFAGPVDTYAGGHPLLGEGIGNDVAPVKPGNIVTFNPGTGLLQLGGWVAGSDLFNPYVAIEKGSGVGADIDTPYENGETIVFVKVRSGERVWVRSDASVDTSRGNGLTIGENGRVKGIVEGETKFFVATGAFGSTVAVAGTLILVEAI